MTKYLKGQLLVEVMIGVAVVMVGLLAIIQISRKSVNNAGFSEREAIATNYTSEGIEWVRIKKRTMATWKDFFVANGSVRTYCINTLDTNPLAWPSVTGSCANYDLDNVYKREVTLSSNTPNMVETVGVTVTLSWLEGTRVNAVKQSTSFVKY